MAVIDLGTNTFHLLIAEVGTGKPVLLHREKQPVKIGMGGINQKVITSAAIDRAITCLRHFSNLLKQYEVPTVVALGTSALRNADNGLEVIDQIEKETGIHTQLISGDQEAEYIYLGVRSALDLGSKPSLIVDIGGGSVEFIIGDQTRIHWKLSVETGAQRLLELFQQHDPILPEEIERLNQHFKVALTQVGQAIQKFKPLTLVGSSGTFDTLSEIHCIRQRIPVIPDASETPLTVDAFHEIYIQLITGNREVRMKIPGMIEMRVDMIVVASCLVKFLLDEFGFKQIRVSSFSLKEGVLTTLSA